MNLEASLRTVAVGGELKVSNPSVGAGAVATAVEQHLAAWPSSLKEERARNSFHTVKSDRSESARDLRRFEFKAYLAVVAMHLSDEWRRSLFRQVDLLLCADDEWDEEDPLPTLASWRTFVRLVIHYQFKRRPGLTVSQGNVSATWIHEDIRVTLDCLPNDHVSWVGSRPAGEGERDAVAGDTALRSLREFLVPFSAHTWLF